MKNKLIFKILACLVAGVSVFSLAGCGNNGGGTAESEPPEEDGPPVIGGEQEDDEKNEGGGDIENNPVKGAVVIETAKGDLEAAYVTWKIDENAKWYNVYVKASTDATYSTKLDDQLVRKYSTYFRADAVGLAAGSYDFKVVPVDKTSGNEATEYASEAKNLTVQSHIRVGFAFVDGTSSGAYNEDGTLKSDARVIYITEKSKDTVSMEVTGANANPCVGLQAILSGYGKGKESRSLAIRLVGNVTDLAEMEDGDIVISSKTDKDLYAGAGITFEGIGSDATVNGWGIRVKNARNVEIRNLGFMNCNSKEGDNIGLQQGNDHIWVHNCDMFYGDAGSDADQIKGDGALDTKNTSHVTHSFNHFWDSGKCNLQGMKDETADNCVTYHHNWYDHSDSRHPRIRTCTVHVFNNYFDGNSKYGVGVTYGASAFVENNYFRSTATMKPMLSSMQGTDIVNGAANGTFSKEDGGIIKSFGNEFDVSASNLKLKVCTKETIKGVDLDEFEFDYDCFETETRDEQVPAVKAMQGGTTYSNFDTADNMYEYEVETPEQAVETVKKYAGRIGGGDLKHEFNNATDDGDYAVIPALKEMVTNYRSELLDVGGVYVGGGDVSVGGGSGDEEVLIPVEGAIVCSFVDGKPSHEAIKASGNAKNGEREIHAINQTFASGLKFESDTYVRFTLTEEMTITLYLDGDAGKRVKIDGTQVATQNVGGDMVITMTLQAGEHELTKGDSINLYYLILTPNA